MEKVLPSHLGAACYGFADGGRAVPDLLSWQEFSLRSCSNSCDFCRARTVDMRSSFAKPVAIQCTLSGCLYPAFPICHCSEWTHAFPNSSKATVALKWLNNWAFLFTITARKHILGLFELLAKALLTVGGVSSSKDGFHPCLLLCREKKAFESTFCLIRVMSA